MSAIQYRDMTLIAARCREMSERIMLALEREDEEEDHTDLLVAAHDLFILLAAAWKDRIMPNDERDELDDELEEIRTMPASQLEESIKAEGGNPDELAERGRLAIHRALNACGLLTDLEAFEGWAVRAFLADRDREGRVWFYRNGGDGLFPAFIAGMEYAKRKATKAEDDDRRAGVEV